MGVNAGSDMGKEWWGGFEESRSEGIFPEMRKLLARRGRLLLSG
jgi:hypothetical protein